MVWRPGQSMRTDRPGQAPVSLAGRLEPPFVLPALEQVRQLEEAQYQHSLLH